MSEHEATERLRRMLRNDRKDDQYAIYGTRSFVASTKLYHEDLECLASAYLREHDETPLSAATMESLGWDASLKIVGDGWCAKRESPIGLLSLWNDGDVSLDSRKLPVAPVTTIVQLRRLLDVLGINLKG